MTLFLTGGPGDSIETAWVIHGIESTEAGVRAEHDHLDGLYPGWSLLVQLLVRDGSRVFDQIELDAGTGRFHVQWFDISDWFGS